MSALPALVADAVSVTLDGRLVVDNAAFALAPGEVTVLVGPNGAGKTTLLRSLAGLVPADGKITFNGNELSALGAQDRARRIAYLPQGHVFHWPLTVAAVVALGRYPHGSAFGGVTPDDQAAVAAALSATGTQALAERTVTTLSGGERARVALARALATQAPVLLADEPMASLDPRQQLLIMEVLRRTARAGAAILAVMHDLVLAGRLADRVLVMDRGRLIADAPPATALGADILADVFGIESIALDADGAQVNVPWKAIELSQRPSRLRE